jgi:hypothetical protein
MTTLSTSTFDRLGGEDLLHYVEPLVAKGRVDVSQEQVLHLLERLHKYDHFHLVYALEICASNDPRSLAPMLPGFLQHAEDSVVCAAINALARLPTECVSEQLLQSLQTVTVESRWTHVVKALQDKLQVRLDGRS